MKRTLFDPTSRAAVIERLHRLTPDTPHLWGRMSAPQMVAHLIDQMQHCLGDKPCAPDRTYRHWPLIRWAAIYWIPWPKGAKGPPGAFVTKPTEWDADMTTLIALLDRFGAKDSSGKWPEHAQFGPMSGKDWGFMSYKPSRGLHPGLFKSWPSKPEKQARSGWRRASALHAILPLTGEENPVGERL
jgi:hypothetical protein